MMRTENTGVAIESNAIRAMSFNIRYDNPDDGKNAWPHRQQMVFDLLKKYKPDVGGLQEVLYHQQLELETALPDYSFLGIGREDGKNTKDSGEFCPVFFRKKRFMVREYGNFWLSSTPQLAGSIGWDAACPRILSWVKLLDRKTEQILFLANTHIDHRGQRAMINSGHLIIESLKKLAGKMPTILCGDFNTTPDTPLYQLLTGKTMKNTSTLPTFKDCRTLPDTFRFGPEFTSHGFCVSGERPEIIDYIFIRNNLISTKHWILSDSQNDRYPSDHMPVLAELHYIEN